MELAKEETNKSLAQYRQPRNRYKLRQFFGTGKDYQKIVFSTNVNPWLIHVNV